jgi:hypothetical protein
MSSSGTTLLPFFGLAFGFSFGLALAIFLFLIFTAFNSYFDSSSHELPPLEDWGAVSISHWAASPPGEFLGLTCQLVSRKTPAG